MLENFTSIYIANSKDYILSNISALDVTTRKTLNTTYTTWKNDTKPYYSETAKISQMYAYLQATKTQLASEVSTFTDGISEGGSFSKYIDSAGNKIANVLKNVQSSKKLVEDMKLKFAYIQDQCIANKTAKAIAVKMFEHGIHEGFQKYLEEVRGGSSSSSRNGNNNHHSEHLQSPGGAVAMEKSPILASQPQSSPSSSTAAKTTTTATTPPLPPSPATTTTKTTTTKTRTTTAKTSPPRSQSRTRPPRQMSTSTKRESAILDWSAHFAWVADSVQKPSFEYEISLPDGQKYQPANSKLSSTRITISSLRPGTTYGFRLRVEWYGALGPWSNFFYFTTRE